MMNCFETRSEFVNFWRGTMGADRRREFLAHLKGCPKCDGAFRAFALTAPMLHPAEAPTVASRSSGPLDLGDEPRMDAARTEEILRRASVYRLRPHPNRTARNWSAVATAVSAVAATILIAYFSVATPAQSLDDALSASTSIAEQSGSDFLGQQMPELPQTNGDLAG